MASAASAADAVTICANATGTLIKGVNLTLNLNAPAGPPPGFVLGPPVPGTCQPGYGDQYLTVTGPLGGTGPIGPTGDAGTQGGTGGTGAVGNKGPKGALGVTGGTGAPGGAGDVGGTGPRGVTGADGPAPTGVTGGTGVRGDAGIPGPQGPSGAQGVVGPTGLAVDGAVKPGCTPSLCTPFFNNVIQAGPGKLGNTVTAGGGSQIILTCPSGTLVSGGAQVIPADVPPAQAVRGVLESSFPNPANSAQWIVSAVVTATSVNTNPAPPPAGPGLIVDPYVICR